MKSSDFTDPSTGDLVEIGGGFHAFVPNPLPRGIAIPGSLARELGDTRAVLGSLNQGARSLPGPKLFFHAFQKREAVLSSRIEGTVTTLDEAFQDAAVHEDDADTESQTDDAREVRNYEHALETGIAALADGRLLNFSLLQALHQDLMRSVRGAAKAPGQVREQQAYVADRTVLVPGDARFIPPPPHHLTECVEELDRYLAERAGDDGLIRVALSHYQFETIHPFSDGNGRTGRLLIALQMVWEGLLDSPYLYVSPTLERRRQDYYDGLLAVSQRGTFLDWIGFFLDAVRTTATETLDRLESLRTLNLAFEQRLTSLLTQKPLQVARRLFQFPYITVPVARRILQSTSRTAQQAIDRLVEAKVLELMDFRPSTSRGRPPKLYRCREVLDIMRE